MNKYKYSTTSVQCDSEPVVIKIPTPPPQVIDENETTESDLTESSTYTTDKSSTTITSEKSDKDTDSYFSDGAWLLSKSEGQIIPIEQDGKQSIISIIRI